MNRRTELSGGGGRTDLRFCCGHRVGQQHRRMIRRYLETHHASEHLPAVPARQQQPLVMRGCLPSGGQQFLQREADILSNLTQERGRDIAALMDRHGCHPPVRMLELFVGSSLPHLLESQPLKECDHLARLEDRRLHRSHHRHGLDSDELGLKLRSPVFKQERDDFAQIGL